MSDGVHGRVSVWVDGRRVLVPAALLERQEDGSYCLPLDLGQLQRLAGVEDDAVVVPVIEERLIVTKRRRTTGRVRVNKTVEEREEIVDVPLLDEQIEVERVRVDRLVDAAPPVRQEGDDLVVPLLEEVLVVEKRLLLKEEIRLRKRTRLVHKPQRVVLRSERAEIERLDENQDEDEGQAGEEPEEGGGR